MAQITVSDEIAARIYALVQHENSSIEEMFTEFLMQREIPIERKLEPLDNFIGMIDVDISDASSTVKESVRRYMNRRVNPNDNSG